MGHDFVPSRLRSGCIRAESLRSRLDRHGHFPPGRRSGRLLWCCRLPSSWRESKRVEHARLEVTDGRWAVPPAELQEGARGERTRKGASVGNGIERGFLRGIGRRHMLESDMKKENKKQRGGDNDDASPPSNCIWTSFAHSCP